MLVNMEYLNRKLPCLMNPQISLSYNRECPCFLSGKRVKPSDCALTGWYVGPDKLAHSAKSF